MDTLKFVYALQAEGMDEKQAGRRSVSLLQLGDLGWFKTQREAIDAAVKNPPEGEERT